MLNIVNESILDQKVDAIINPANSFLAHDGGLARIIHEAASAPIVGTNPFRPSYYDESLMALQKTAIPTGRAVVQTTAGPLPFKGIIHAVGPIWGGGDLFEADLLFSAYESACEVGKAAGFTSLAFPAISMGIFGVPREVVAREAYWGTIAFAREFDVTICLTSDEDRDAFREAVEEENGADNPDLLGWQA